jgi:hypothetical protein
MQPSTQVTHIPEFGVTDSSVLFFVSVAADEFTFEYGISHAPFFSLSCISQATQGSM